MDEFPYIILTFTKTGFIVHIFMLGNSDASFQYCIVLKELRFTYTFLYSNVSGLVHLSCLYSLSRYFIDLRMPVVIQHEFL